MIRRLYAFGLALMMLLGAACSDSSEVTDPLSPIGSDAISGDQPASEDAVDTNADDAEPATTDDIGEDDRDPDSVGDSTSSTSQLRGLTVQGAIDALGPVDATWAGPLFTDYVCAHLPQDHARAVLSNYEADAEFTFFGAACEMRVGGSRIRVRAEDARFAGQYDADVDNMSWKIEPEPIAGIGDRAHFGAAPDFQEVVIGDGLHLWTIGGPGTDDLPTDQFLEFASLVLRRFSPETRSDNSPRMLTGSELAAAEQFVTDYVAERNAVATGASSDNLTLFASERLGRDTADLLERSPVTLEPTMLRASRIDSTSRGDVIHLHICVVSADVDDPGRPVSHRDPELVILVDGDRLQIAEWESRGTKAAPYCLEPGFLQTHDAEEAAEQAELLAEISGDSSNGSSTLDIAAMTDAEFREFLLSDGNPLPVSTQSFECYIDSLVADLDRQQVLDLRNSSGESQPGEVQEAISTAQFDCVATELLQVLASLGTPSLDAEQVNCVTAAIETDQMALAFVESQLAEDGAITGGETSTEIGQYLLELANCE